MDSYAITLRSRDCIYATDTTSQYTVSVPVIPDHNYKCSVSFIAASLTVSSAYCLQFKSPAITRTLSTITTAPSPTGDDGWITACILAGSQPSNTGVVYFTTSPQQLQVRIILQSTLAVASTILHNVVQCVFENIDA